MTDEAIAAPAPEVTVTPAPDAVDVHVLVDRTGTIPLGKLVGAALDMTLWAENILAPAPPLGWGRPVVIRAATPDRPPQPDEFVIALLPGPAPQGELADHGTTPNDVQAPESHVYPETILAGRTLDDGWSAITDAITHEVAEATVDRWGRFSAQADAGAIYALEVCDPVQGTGRAWGDGGTYCCGVTLPAYWSPPVTGDGPFDSEGAVHAPFEVLPAGFTQRWDGQQNQWVIPAAHVANAPGWMAALPAARVNRRNARLVARPAA